MFNVQNCTCGVLGGKLLLIDVRWKYYIVMCVIVHKKYVALMLLTAYRDDGLRVNMLKGDTEIDIKNIAHDYVD